MTYPLPSDTQYIRVERRSYELFGKKVGRDGMRRIIVVVSMIIGIPWVLLTWIIVGNPLGMLWLYLLPPSILVVLLTRPDKGGRVSYLALYDRVLYLVRRRRRIIPSPGRGHHIDTPQPFILEPALTAIDARTHR